MYQVIKNETPHGDIAVKVLKDGVCIAMWSCWIGHSDAELIEMATKK